MINKLRRYWCHKILPLVYDDSLSYYEYLCKLTAKLNEMIDELTAWEEAHATTVQVVQELGEDTTKVMSQKAVTDAFNDAVTDMQNLVDGMQQDIGDQNDKIDALFDRVTALEYDVEAIKNQIATRLLVNDGEVTSSRIYAGDYSADLDDVKYHNKAVLLGTDFMARGDIAHVPTQTPGTLVTRAVLDDNEISGAVVNKPGCVIQEFHCLQSTTENFYVRSATWNVSTDAYVWSAWAHIE